MKTRCALLAAALALLMAGCRAEKLPESSPSPSLEAVSAQPEAQLAEAPAPSAEPSQNPMEELLAQMPLDDDHDAFLVDTGGRMGTLLVTAERGELNDELWEYPVSFVVWNPEDMSQPIQEMEKMTFNVFRWHEELDANFDGYMDFSYTYAMGNQPTYSFLWLWDEDAGQFVEVPEYSRISSPRCNPETGIIDGWARESAAGDGVTTFHRWEDGELVCVRRIEAYAPWEGGPAIVSVEERVDGELKQVYCEEFPWDTGEMEGMEAWRQEQSRWENLNYHGEP